MTLCIEIGDNVIRFDAEEKDPTPLRVGSRVFSIPHPLQPYPLSTLSTYQLPICILGFNWDILIPLEMASKLSFLYSKTSPFPPTSVLHD